MCLGGILDLSMQIDLERRERTDDPFGLKSATGKGFMGFSGVKRIYQEIWICLCKYK